MSSILHNAPAPSTCIEFARNIAEFYPGGISDAIQDLMWKAVAERNRKILDLRHAS